MFFEVEQAGDYKIVVHHGGGLNEPEEYGLAWWYGTPPELMIAGDFDSDSDSDVDGDDLNQWESDYAVNGESDADGDGDSDGETFSHGSETSAQVSNFWQRLRPFQNPRLASFWRLA